MKVENPLISVVIPAFNSAAYIKETVDSVLNQTHTNIEIIIVDDGSTDNTAAVIASTYGQDARIIYKKIENSGSPTARNVGIQLARGQFIAAVDADDIWPEYKLADQLQLIGTQQDVIVLGNIEKFTVSQSGERVGGNFVELPASTGCYLDTVLSIALEKMVLFNTFLAPASLMKTYGLWDRDQVTAHDWENWIRLAKTFRFIHADNVYQYYRKHQASTTRKHRPLQALTYQLRAIDLHSDDIKSKGLEPNKYKRIRFKNWIDIYLYEQRFWLCMKLLFSGTVNGNLLFTLTGVKLLLKTILGTIKRVVQ